VISTLWETGKATHLSQILQTAYGIFAQACWAQYDDKAGIKEYDGEARIEEFHIQCSDWWEDLAEKE
jgi:hypothetical protein